MAKGVIVKLKATPTIEDEIDLEASNTGVIYGVTMHVIPDDEWGDIQIAGKALVLAGGTIAVGVRCMPTTGGKSLTGTANTSNLGIAITAGAASALHEVELAGPGGTEVQS
jgi:hypothetical protein